MATAGFERGLLLRSPARFQRTAHKLVQLYQRHLEAADRDPAIRDAVLRAWMDAEAYNLASYHTVGRVAKGGTVGAEASTNKIFWSELDLQMHETAMRILGRAPSCETTPKYTTGSRVSCSRRPARSTPAPTRSSATSSPSACWACRSREVDMDFTFTEDQVAFRDSMSRFLMTEAAPEMLREVWETDSGRSAELRAKIAEQGLTGLSVPEAEGGWGWATSIGR